MVLYDITDNTDVIEVATASVGTKWLLECNDDCLNVISVE